MGSAITNPHIQREPMMEYNLSPAECWLIFGFITILFEICFISGIGLVFAGFGAITTAGVISIDPNMLTYQYPLFAAFSFAWCGVLWQPLKKYLHNKSAVSHTSDLVGVLVEVTGSALVPGGKVGQVKWSGTILNARLDSEVSSEQIAGTILRVKEVDGSIVICTTR